MVRQFCLATAGYLLATWPILGRAPAAGAVVTWDELPTPVVTRADWTTFSHSGAVNDVLLRDDLLWIATDGGLVARHRETGESVSFLPEHGLVGSRVTAVTAVGRRWRAPRPRRRPDTSLPRRRRRTAGSGWPQMAA